MIIRSLCITIAMAALACKTCPAIPFDDNFDDGDLAGWEIKQGDWYNAGHSLMSSYDNYGIIWVADSFGLDQRIDVDAYFDGSASSKTAQLRVRSGDAGSGGNRFFDHGYFAAVVSSGAYIYNAVQPGRQNLLGQVALPGLSDGWHSLAFSVEGLGNDTHLQVWVDGDMKLDVYDTQGSQHDDGGYVGLGSSNHINRRIEYDNVQVVPEPATLVLLLIGGIGLAFRRCRAGQSK